MTDIADLAMQSAHGPNLHICGMAPRVRLTTLTDWECWNCKEKRVVRLFSGSGWYEDDAICAACGEDNSSGYRPFERAWRKKNIKRAEEWLSVAIPRDEYSKETMRVISHEMGMDDPALHTFRTFKNDDVCDACAQPASAHAASEPPDSVNNSEEAHRG